MSEGEGNEGSGETIKEKTPRVESMMQALRDLNASSTGMTKQLDDEYYALLERLTALQARALALETVAKKMCDGYAAYAVEVRSLGDEISGQLCTVANLDQQEAEIARYVSLIRQVGEKIRALEGRVSTIRKRIDKWEDADRAWQERTRKRLKIFWSVTFFVATVVIAFAVGVKYAGTRLDGGRGSAVTTAPPPGRRLSTPRAPADGGGGETSRVLPWKGRQEDGEPPVLGAFDEL